MRKGYIVINYDIQMQNIEELIIKRFQNMTSKKIVGH